MIQPVQNWRNHWQRASIRLGTSERIRRVVMQSGEFAARLQADGTHLIAQNVACYRLADRSGRPYVSCCSLAGEGMLERALVMACLPGSARPAMAPISDRAAATLIAGENPLLNAWAERKPPMLANTAARIATPNAPPSWRSMLTVPDALPISLGATALTTAFWAAGMASAPPMPAMISGTTKPA